MSVTRAVYVPGGRDPVFGVHHLPEPSQTCNTAVLLCAPFGWDEVASYRSRRAWAGILAGAGLPTLRFDLPGTGDSAGSPMEPGLVDSWIDAIKACAEWLRQAPGTERVATIGFGPIGGLLATQATADGLATDDLVLWGAPARGRNAVRELRAFAGMIDSRLSQLASPAEIETAARAIPDGALAVSGFLLSKESVERLSSLDVTRTPLNGTGRRAMLLERSGVSVDRRLVEHLDAGGYAVEVAEGPSYNAIIDHPQALRPQIPEFQSVADWIRLAAAEAGGDASRQDADGTMDVLVDGEPIRERPIALPGPDGTLAGIVAEPVSEDVEEFGAVFLNAGATRRIGPGRLWVEVSRRWAARGIRSARLDLAGLGDSDGNSERFVDTGAMYSETMIQESLSALDGLVETGFPRRMILIGLCSGAYWSLHDALRDERVEAAFMINLRAVAWDAGFEKIRGARKAVGSVRRNATSVRRIAQRSSVSRLLEIVRALLSGLLRLPGQLAARRSQYRSVKHIFGELTETRKAALFVFSEGEDLFDELDRPHLWDEFEATTGVRIERIPGRDHDLRPLVSQRHVHTRLDAALDRYREASGAPQVRSLAANSGTDDTL